MVASIYERDDFAGPKSKITPPKIGNEYEKHQFMELDSNQILLRSVYQKTYLDIQLLYTYTAITVSFQCFRRV